MSTRPIEVCPAKQAWQEHEIDVRLLINNGKWSVWSISREEALTLRDKLTDFLEDSEQ